MVRAGNDELEDADEEELSLDDAVTTNESDTAELGPSSSNRTVETTPRGHMVNRMDNYLEYVKSHKKQRSKKRGGGWQKHPAYVRFKEGIDQSLLFPQSLAKLGLRTTYNIGTTRFVSDVYRQTAELNFGGKGSLEELSILYQAPTSTGKSVRLQKSPFTALTLKPRGRASNGDKCYMQAWVNWTECSNCCCRHLMDYRGNYENLSDKDKHGCEGWFTKASDSVGMFFSIVFRSFMLENLQWKCPEAIIAQCEPSYANLPSQK